MNSYDMVKKKKVAFYIESMIVGGAEKVLIDLVNRLNAADFDITVISVFKKSVYSNYNFRFESNFEPHIKYKYLVDNNNSKLYLAFNYLYNKLNKKLIHKFLIKEQFDTEVAFYEGFPTEFVAASPQNSHKIAWLHIEQDNIYKDIKEKDKTEKHALYKKFNEIICVSNAVGNSFNGIFPDLHPNTCYNPVNGSKIVEMAKAEIPEIKIRNKINFVTVGRLTYQKAYPRLLDVFGKLLKIGFDFNLQIIGDGDLMAMLQEKVKSNQLEDKVQLLGFRANPYPYIKNADYFISSSYYEGLSTVVIEAQLLGVPTVVTNCTGMNEIVEDGVNGLICENSEDGLFSVLRQVLIAYQIDPNKKKLVGKLPRHLIFEEAIRQIEEMIS